MMWEIQSPDSLNKKGMVSHFLIGSVKNENLKHRFGYESELGKKTYCVESTVTEEKKNRKWLTFRFHA